MENFEKKSKFCFYMYLGIYHMLNPKMILKIITTFELQDFFEDEGVSTTMIPEETNPEENVQVRFHVYSCLQNRYLLVISHFLPHRKLC